MGYFNEADLNLLVVQLARRRDGVGPRAAAGWGYMRAWVVGVVLSLEGIGVVVQLGAELSKEVELHRLGYWGGSGGGGIRFENRSTMQRFPIFSPCDPMPVLRTKLAMS